MSQVSCTRPIFCRLGHRRSCPKWRTAFHQRIRPSRPRIGGPAFRYRQRVRRHPLPRWKSKTPLPKRLSRISFCNFPSCLGFYYNLINIRDQREIKFQTDRLAVKASQRCEPPVLSVARSSVRRLPLALADRQHDRSGPRRSGKGPGGEYFTGVEEFQVGAKVWPGIRGALIEPMQAHAAFFAPKAPPAGLGVGLAIPQVDDDESIDIKTIHHLMHAGCPPLYRPSNRPLHDTLPVSLRSKPIIAMSARQFLG